MTQKESNNTFGEDSPLFQLMQNYAQTGKVVGISVRPLRKEQPKVLDEVSVSPEEGLIGDHYSSKTSQNRQVTLIQYEDLQAIASFLGKSELSPLLTRRNIVVKGLNLLTLKDKQFQIGNAILEMTGECHPCSRMEENLGKGGYNAMRGRGGITAKVIRAGKIKIGDELKSLTSIST